MRGKVCQCHIVMTEPARFTDLSVNGDRQRASHQLYVKLRTMSAFGRMGVSYGIWISSNAGAGLNAIMGRRARFISCESVMSATTLAQIACALLPDLLRSDNHLRLW